MAKILNVEKPQYINNVIDTYTKNRVGEYSKFLSSSPMFVTYYHMCMPLSRQDVGTGSIETELGERSPIRFNKICNFPIYNLPELRPDLEYDEAAGFDISLDLNDITILPNTIKPRAGDYFIVKIPRSKEVLFRVNNFEYNTIQSNDYYRIDADIKDIGDNIELNRMKGQISETFLTVFENIGTDDRCFIRSTDTEYINSLADLFYKLRDFYKNAFYVNALNSFTFQTGQYSQFGSAIYRYDPYLERFINEAGIYYDENSEKSIYCTPADVLDDDFDMQYQFSIYNAILERSLEMLRPYTYVTTDIITPRTSPYNVMGYCGEAMHLHSYRTNQHPDRDNSKTATTGDSNNSITITPCCSCCRVATVKEVNGCEVWYDMSALPACIPTWSLSQGVEYFASAFLNQIIGKQIDTDDYCELIVFNFIHGIDMKIDRSFILDELEKNEHIYYYLPLVIYIIGMKYKEVFVSEQEIEV